jgi:hypothetical protein
MSHLDPTYLRYIFDSLEKGTIQAENASELPDGLIGLYEETFDDQLPVLERQYIFRLFTLFALLKKEVSISFVAEVLEDSADNITDFISTYSSWFNSPESGKYQIYHERLKVYVLQKLSEREIDKTHEKLILRLEKAIEEKKADELEKYALEFISAHFLLNAYSNQNNSNSKIELLAHNTAFLQRQIYISDQYIWSQACIQNAIEFITFVNQKDKINNTKNIVKLGLASAEIYFQEQNAGERIIRLLRDSKYEKVLLRFENFGGESERDKSRLFVLFVLCLIHIFHENIKVNIDFITKLCNLINRRIELLNSFSLIPHEFLFELACRLEKIGISHVFLTSKIKNWDFSWLKNINTIGTFENNIITEIIKNEIQLDNLNLGFSLYSIRLCELNQFEEAEQIIEFIKNNPKDNEIIFSKNSNIKEKTLREIIKILVGKDKFLKAEYFLKKIEDYEIRLSAFEIIFKGLMFLRKFDEADILIRNNHKDYELAHYLLKFIKIQIKNFEIINSSKLDDIISLIQKLDNKESKVGLYSILSEISFYAGNFDFSDHYIKLAYDLWVELSMGIPDLEPIISSLEAQNKPERAREILGEIYEIINETISDDIARANCFHELRELEHSDEEIEYYEDSVLHDIIEKGDEYGAEDVDVNEFIKTPVEEVDGSDNYSSKSVRDNLSDNHLILFNDIGQIKANALKFINKSFQSDMIEKLEFKNYFEGKKKGIICNKAIYIITSYRTLNPGELNQELQALRGCLRSFYSKNIIDDLLKYCVLSTIFFDNENLTLSDSILKHARSIAENSIDQYPESTMNFSAGPKYKCLYIVCFHYLIQNRIKEATEIMDIMDNTYRPYVPDVFTLSEEILSWFSSTNQKHYDSLLLLFNKLNEELNESWSYSVSVERIQNVINLLKTFDFDSNRGFVVTELNRLIDNISSKNISADTKEDCMILLIDTLLYCHEEENALLKINSYDFSNKSKIVLAEKIAIFYLKKDQNLSSVITQLDKLKIDFSSLNLDRILNIEVLSEIDQPYFVSMISYFFRKPEILVKILQKFTLCHLFFGENASLKEVDNLYQTLNLQWAIDLKDELDMVTN